jgi:hypothetical protein
MPQKTEDLSMEIREYMSKLGKKGGAKGGKLAAKRMTPAQRTARAQKAAAASAKVRSKKAKAKKG